jgi:hypothetical protein
VYAVSVEGSTAAPPHHHRSSAVSTLILVASAALLAMPILAGLHRGFEAPAPAPLGVLQSPSTLPIAPVPAAGGPDVDTAIHEQFIVLDEVLITSTYDEGPEDGR